MVPGNEPCIRAPSTMQSHLNAPAIMNFGTNALTVSIGPDKTKTATLGTIPAGLSCVLQDGSMDKQIWCLPVSVSTAPNSPNSAASHSFTYTYDGVTNIVYFFKSATPSSRLASSFSSTSSLSGQVMAKYGTNEATVVSSEIISVPSSLSWVVAEDASDFNARLMGSIADGQGLMARITVFPNKGTLLQGDTFAPIPSSGLVTYGRTVGFRPETNAFGVKYASFEYRLVADSGVESANIVVNIDVEGVNDAPETAHTTYTVDEGADQTVMLAAIDPDGFPLAADQAYVITKMPKHGKLYQMQADGTAGDEIKEVFKPWAFGVTKSQWALNVSVGSVYSATGPWNPQRATGLVDPAKFGCHSEAYSPTTMTGDPDGPREYVEFEVAEPVWVKSVIQYWSAGGWITSFSAQRPDGTWSNIWRGQNYPSRAFSPPLCAPNWLSSHFRIEFELNAQMSVWSCLDGVEVTGEYTLPAGLVISPTRSNVDFEPQPGVTFTDVKEVMYVADLQFSGEDTFEYQVNDCLERTFAIIDHSAPSKDTVVTMQVVNINDPPKLLSVESDGETPLVTTIISPDMVYVALPAIVVDYDDNFADIEVVVTKMPFEALTAYDVGEILTSKENSSHADDDGLLALGVGSVINCTHFIGFLSDCRDSYTTELAIMVTDGAGATTNGVIKVHSVCTRFVAKSLQPGPAMAFGVLGIIGMAIALVMIGLCVKFWKTPIIESAAPVYLITMLLGCIIVFSGIVLQALGPPGSRCGSGLAMLSMGMTTILMSFLVKTQRIDKIFNSKGFKSVTQKDMAIPYVAGVGLEMIFVIIWQQVSPMQNVLMRESSSSGYEVCAPVDDNGVGWALAGIALCTKALLLVYLCKLAYNVRKVNSAFNESKLIGFCIYNFAFFVLVLFPMGLTLGDPTLGFSLMSIGVLVPTVGTLATMFGLRFSTAIFKPEENTLNAISGGRFGKVQSLSKDRKSAKYSNDPEELIAALLKTGKSVKQITEMARHPKPPKEKTGSVISSTRDVRPAISVDRPGSVNEKPGSAIEIRSRNQ
jgi:hypothetical protein